jgi:hypothetical protein
MLDQQDAIPKKMVKDIRNLATGMSLTGRASCCVIDRCRPIECFDFIPSSLHHQRTECHWKIVGMCKPSACHAKILMQSNV